jgi:hypothetical protein
MLRKIGRRSHRKIEEKVEMFGLKKVLRKAKEGSTL